MKKLLLFAFAVFAFAACTQNDVEELSANRQDVPETLTIGFEGDDTRIQLNSNQKTVWNENDNITVFYHSDANQKWQFQGETGERQGQFKRLQNAESTTKIANIVVAYPYSEDYFLNTQSYNIEATLPAVQHYAEDSYGVGDNLMVSQSEFTQFSLKSVCGWLKIQLTGNGERVTHLMLRGNNEEQLAGLIYVDTDTAESTLVSEMGGFDDMENSIGGGLIPDDAIVTEITLNCGEGVVLGSAAKSFYIAVPPQTFEKGFTVEVECDNGTSITKSTSEPITIERNHIQPMEAIEYDGVLPEVYELAYRTNDGKALDPLTTEGFGGEFEENIFDAATGEGKLVFAGAITTIPNQAFGLCENLTWIEIPLGVTSIGASAFSGCSSMEEIIIPASVTSVGSEAFQGCTCKAYINCSGVSFSGAGFAEVVIGDSVTTIGYMAFYECDSLTSITIPDSVTTIGDSAFSDCYSLTNITIPDSVTTIGNYAFKECDSLTSVTIPDSVTTIGNYAFKECDSLTSVTIPDSVTTIGRDAFYSCDRLKSVTIPDSVTTIGNYAFAYCDSLTSITIPDSVTTIGGEAFRDCSSLTSVTIGDSVTTIGGWAFYNCDSLTRVYCEATTPPSLVGSYVFDYNASGRTIYVPEESVRQYKIAAGWSEYTDAIVGFDFSITSIINYTTSDDQIINTRLPIISNTYSNGIGTIEFLGSIIPVETFYDCNSLTSVTIGDSVTTIGEGAFADCTNLVEFNGKFASEDGRCLIVDGTLNSFAIGCGATEYTIPDSVTTIGGAAFFDCNSLTSITIPDSVTTIGDDAFRECDNLTSVTIGDSVTTIGEYAFRSCNNLTSITIPDSVTTIGEWAFYYCFRLTSITIPDSVTTIGKYAFYHCTSLTNVDCEATTPPSLGGYVFEENASGRKIYVPAASVEAYKTADYWSEYADAIVGNGHTPEFEPTHIANECMWGGYSSISWGNYYNVQGENFSLQLHFCTDVALENSIAAGKYEWVNNSAITNSNPERFSTRTFTVNGNSVVVESGKATVKISGEEYTINLTLDGRDGNTYYIQYVGKLNVKYEAPNEGGDDDGDPNTITLNTFVYNSDLRSNYLGYLFEATAENVELGICISSKSCSPTHIDAGDYTYNQYPEDHAYAFQLRGSKINGTDVSQDPNATMNVAVNGGVYTITIVTNGYTLTYNGTL